MCCSDYDDCDFDILMMVLRCFAEPKKKFVARVIIGILFDGIEGLSIEFKEIADNINIYLIGLTAVLYVILCICIVVKRSRGIQVQLRYFFQGYIVGGSLHYFLYNFKFRLEHYSTTLQSFGGFKLYRYISDCNKHCIISGHSFKLIFSDFLDLENSQSC